MTPDTKIETKNIKKQNIVSSTDAGTLSNDNRKNVFSSKNFNLWYGDNHALQDINLDFKENDISAIIGP